MAPIRTLSIPAILINHFLVVKPRANLTLLHTSALRSEAPTFYPERGRVKETLSCFAPLIDDLLGWSG